MSPQISTTTNGESASADTFERGSVSARLAMALWLILLVAVVAGVALAWVNGFPFGFDPWGLVTGGAVIIGSLGALVASRRPGNAIGWIMVGMGLVDGLASFGLQYGYFGLVDRTRPLWGAEFLATVPYGAAIGLVFGLTISFLLLLFPDGALPSRRWRPVAVVAGVGVAAMTVGLTWFAVDMGAEALLGQVAVGGLDASQAEGAAKALNEGGHVLVFVAFPLGVASLFVRRNRSGPLQRQQLRWFAYGSVIFLVSIFSPLPGLYGLWFEIVATTFLFASIGIAILRYRLYDIDRIVSRTVAYATVSGLLVGLFFSVVFLLQLVLPAESDLATAASTLAVAAAFNPLRRRIQEVVDRRFNRSRYNAALTVEHFSRRLRGATDVGSLGEELGRVTASVMEPAHLSLWLREHGPTNGSEFGPRSTGASTAAGMTPRQGGRVRVPTEIGGRDR
jgi:hypothetical protein